MPNLARHFILLLALTACASGGQPEPKIIPENELGSAAAGDPTGDQEQLPGIDVSKLSPEKQARFGKLVSSLGSPCGKSHSLRTSFTSDSSCKRAPFAVRYVAALYEDDATDVQIRDEYTKKYERHSALEQLDASRAPHFGSDDAPIKLVEFLDYECPHCALFRTALEQVLADKAGKVELFLMMYPLENHHPEAKSAAQAALAASAQGKFKEMHELLFTQTPKHSRDEVTGYARDLGLDLDKFIAGYDAAERHVASDIAQGNIAGVDATPTLFFNDRKYEGPMNAKYLELWIDEELALK